MLVGYCCCCYGFCCLRLSYRCQYTISYFIMAAPLAAAPAAAPAAPPARQHQQQHHWQHHRQHHRQRHLGASKWVFSKCFFCRSAAIYHDFIFRHFCTKLTHGQTPRGRRGGPDGGRRLPFSGASILLRSSSSGSPPRGPPVDRPLRARLRGVARCRGLSFQRRNANPQPDALHIRKYDAICPY